MIAAEREHGYHLPQEDGTQRQLLLWRSTALSDFSAV